MSLAITQNINPASITHSHPYALKSRKRKRQAFNASRLMTSLYPNEDDNVSDDEWPETLEYEYYDAMGRPYLDTAVRPGSILPLIIAQRAREEEEEEKENYLTSDLDCGMFTSLVDPEARCPDSYLTAYNGCWDDALTAYRNSIAEKCTVDCSSEFEDANRKNEELCRQVELARIMASLPRFSTAMLARMKKAEEEKERNKVVRASSTFYSKKSNTKQASNVFGHRRSGGGKKGRLAKNARLVAKIGTISLDSIRDEKYKVLVQTTDETAKQERKVRRENTKVKNEEEADRRAEVMAEIMKRQETTRVQVPETETVVVEETEWQKFKRDELHHAIEKQKMVFDKSPVEYTEFVCVIKPCVKKPVQCKTKKEEVEEALTRILYRDSVRRKDPVRKNVKCTRLCQSFTNGGSCPHRDRCMFAHSLDEYNPIACSFGGRCRNAKCVDGVWRDVGSRGCGFIHPGEDKKAYCDRVSSHTMGSRTPHTGSSRTPHTMGSRTPHTGSRTSNDGSSRTPHTGSSRTPHTGSRTSNDGRRVKR